MQVAGKCPLHPPLEKKDTKSSNAILNENLWEVLIKHVTLSNDINVYRICADAIVAFSNGHLFRPPFFLVSVKIDT